MKTHPSAPLTTANAVYYRAIERVRRNEAALLAHMATLPPKTWTDVGRKEDFEEVEPLAF